jgi:hypothetical protein
MPHDPSPDRVGLKPNRGDQGQENPGRDPSRDECDDRTPDCCEQHQLEHVNLSISAAHGGWPFPQAPRPKEAVVECVGGEWGGVLESELRSPRGLQDSAPMTPAFRARGGDRHYGPKVRILYSLVHHL